jgi:DNA-binding XRE family transcriptional regulator
MLAMAQPAKDIEALMADLRAWVREERGRQLLLARAIGASRQAISSWVIGRSVPTMELGIRLQAFLKAQKPPRRKVAA